MELGNKKERISLGIFLICVFLFFSVFFIEIHPIITFDSDDWAFSFNNRKAVPMTDAWNPIKVLPETLQPLSCAFAAFLIKPICGNLVQSFTIIHSIIVSIFITIYVYMFMRLLKKKFDFKISNNILITIIFLIFHFLIFRKNQDSNIYMFGMLNTTCYFHYLIPALLNCCLVMYFMTEKNWKEGSLLKKSFLLVAIYLAIFSSIFHSIILITYIASILLINLINTIKDKKNFERFLKDNLYEILIILVWFISQLYEVNGGRAHSFGSNSFINSFQICITNFFGMSEKLDIIFAIISSIILITSWFLLIKENKTNNIEIFKILFSGFFTTLYLILLCTALKGGYINRTSVLFGAIFYLYILIFFGLSYIINKYPKILIILPLMIFILYFETNTSGRTFEEPNCYHIGKVCQNIDDYLIEQIIEADKEGKQVVDLHVPKFKTEDNWPIALYSNSIADTLFKYGITKNHIKIKYVIDTEVNDIFDISY